MFEGLGAGESGGDKAVGVAAEEIADDYRGVEGDYFACMFKEIVGGQCADIESVCHAVGQGTKYECRDAEEERQPFAFCGILYRQCHDEAAAYRQNTVAQRRIDGESSVYDVYRAILNRRSRDGERHGKTSYDIKPQNTGKPTVIVGAGRPYELSLPREKIKTETYNSYQSESEETGSCHTSDFQINSTAQTDAYAGKDTFGKIIDRFHKIRLSQRVNLFRA